MGFAWTFWALPNLVCGLALAAAAVFIYGAAPRRPANRSLGLACATGAFIVAGQALQTMATTYAHAYGAFLMAQCAKFLVVPLYLAFVGAALRTPLARPFRGRGARLALVAIGIVGAASVVLRPTWYAGATLRSPAASYVITGAWASNLLDRVASLAFLYCFVAALAAFLASRHGTVQRARTGWYMVAFGIRDGGLAGILIAAPFIRAGSFEHDLAIDVLLPITTTLFVLVLVYGVLRWHVLDLELQIRWTLSRSVLAGLFVAFFFIVSQLAENLLNGSLGLIVGGVSAGLLLFAITPLQRFAERFAGAALPHAHGSPEYASFRRAEIYKGALEEAWADGLVTEPERAILRRLQEKLGLHASLVQAMERDVRATLARP